MGPWELTPNIRQDKRTTNEWRNCHSLQPEFEHLGNHKGANPGANIASDPMGFVWDLLLPSHPCTHISHQECIFVLGGSHLHLFKHRNNPSLQRIKKS